MNSLDRQYLDLLQDILTNGVRKGDRTGTGTISVFGRTIRHKMSEGFPLLTTKKMHWKGIATELVWFLRGDTNIKYLVDNDVNIWTGDAYKKYANSHRTNGNPKAERFLDQLDSVQPMEHSKDSFVEAIKTNPDFAKKHGDLGPIYGKQWRYWDNDHDGYIDQIKVLINDLKTNPDSRRLLVTAWNPNDIPYAVLPPCHYGFQCYTRELAKHEREFLLGIDYPFWWTDSDRGATGGEDPLEYYHIPKRAISLSWNQRSCDTPLGIPYNIASYGLLLEILARECNMVPDELIGNLGDTHIYLNQLEGVQEQLQRSSYDLPSLGIKPRKVSDIGEYEPSDFIINNYQSHPSIKYPLSN